MMVTGLLGEVKRHVQNRGSAGKAGRSAGDLENRQREERKKLRVMAYKEREDAGSHVPEAAIEGLANLLQEDVVLLREVLGLRPE